MPATAIAFANKAFPPSPRRTHADPKAAEDRRDQVPADRRRLGVIGLQHYTVPHLQRHHLLPLHDRQQPQQSRLLGHGP